MVSRRTGAANASVTFNLLKFPELTGFVKCEGADEKGDNCTAG
jgi:hypothetical protein